MKKAEREFETSAAVIGKEMHKWDSFGAIHDGKGGYRLFCNGNAEEIISGMAYSIAHLCEELEDDEIIVEVASRARGILIENRSGVLQ